MRWRIVGHNYLLEDSLGRELGGVHVGAGMISAWVREERRLPSEAAAPSRSLGEFKPVEGGRLDWKEQSKLRLREVMAVVEREVEKDATT